MDTLQDWQQAQSLCAAQVPRNKQNAAALLAYHNMKEIERLPPILAPPDPRFPPPCSPMLRSQRVRDRPSLKTRLFGVWALCAHWQQVCVRHSTASPASG